MRFTLGFLEPEALSSKVLERDAVDEMTLVVGKLPRGGKMRKKEEFEKKWIHPDAENSFRDKVEKVSIN